MTTLFVLGNTNEHTFANSIIAANLASLSEFGEPLREIYVLHTPQSHQKLNASEAWVKHLALNNIHGDIITHRTIEIGIDAPTEAIDKLSRYVETAVRASEPGHLIVDLTNGTTVHKTLLSTVAYILDVPHVYAIDVTRLGKPPGNPGFLEATELQPAYIRSPDSTALDAVAHLSITEVMRYRRIVETHTKRYTAVNPTMADEDFFSANLLHSIRMKLHGDQSKKRDNALYRIASSSIAASVEDLIRVLMAQFRVEVDSDEDRLTFGGRLAFLRKRVESNAPADFDHDFFRRFNDFMLYLRNSSTHKGKLLSNVERFKADLSVKMSFPFLEFYSDIVHPALTATPGASVPTRIKTLKASTISPDEVFFVGLDGDNTGAILEDLFLFANDEKRFRQVSNGVERAIEQVAKRAKEYHSSNSIIFATGDDLLFRGHINGNLLLELQKTYASAAVGNTCSIGYGKSFREVYVALKLAKTRPGKNAIEGVELQ